LRYARDLRIDPHGADLHGGGAERRRGRGAGDRARCERTEGEVSGAARKAPKETTEADMTCRVITLALALLAPVMAHAADLRLPGIFRDHMVLQSGMKVPVWGEAAPGARITVRFAGQATEGAADAAGRW